MAKAKWGGSSCFIISKGKPRAQREQLSWQPCQEEAKETHDHKELIMKNGKQERAKNNKQ
jgi:hypothetical protein